MEARESLPSSFQPGSLGPATCSAKQPVRLHYLIDLRSQLAASPNLPSLRQQLHSSHHSAAESCPAAVHLDTNLVSSGAAVSWMHSGPSACAK